MTRNKIQDTRYKLLIFIITVNLIIFPLSCQGVFWDNSNQAEVINEVKVETNTGGNKIEDGEPPLDEASYPTGQVIEGEAKSSVEIRTIINGEEVESISTESDEGEIRVESRIEVETGKPTESQLVINNQAGPPKSESFGRVTPVRKLWMGFMTSLKSLVKSIFDLF